MDGRVFTENVYKRLNSYLSDVYKILMKYIDPEHLSGLRLFGSYARGTADETSDIDLIIILSDGEYRRLGRKKRNALDAELISLEKRYGFGVPIGNTVHSILRAVEKSTGMFVSHFICSESDWTSQDFANIFGVNKFLSGLIAPRNLVFANISEHIVGIKCINGKENILPSEDKIKIYAVPGNNHLNGFIIYRNPEEAGRLYKNACKSVRLVDIFSSLIMTFTIAISSIAIYPLWRGVIIYSLEAVKWAYVNTLRFASIKNGKIGQKSTYTDMLNKIYYRRPRPDLIRKKINLCKTRGIFGRFGGTFIRFMLDAPIRILKMHITALKHAASGKNKR